MFETSIIYARYQLLALILGRVNRIFCHNDALFTRVEWLTLLCMYTRQRAEPSLLEAITLWRTIACSVPVSYLNQCLHIDNLAARKDRQWNVIRNEKKREAYMKIGQPFWCGRIKGQQNIPDAHTSWIPWAPAIIIVYIISRQWYGR